MAVSRQKVYCGCIKVKGTSWLYQRKGYIMAVSR